MPALENKVKELFQLLDAVEVSDSGRAFFPNQISSVRTRNIQKFSDILEDLRKLAGIKKRPELKDFE